MKNSTLLILSLFTLLFSSCKKDHDFTTTISGQVLEFDTNKPIEGATVYAYGGTSNGNLSNSGANLSTITSTTTDLNGYYHFSFDAEDFSILDMSASHDQYFPVNTIIQNIFRGVDNEIDIILDPHAWLKIHVKNNLPIDEYDIISVGNSFNYDDIDPLYGNTIDTTLIGLVKGNNIDTRAIWFVTKNDVTENYHQNIYCPAHDTTYIEILY